MKTQIIIVGLGYVGKPLFELFSTHYDTFGFDTNSDLVGVLRKKSNNVYNDLTQLIEENQAEIVTKRVFIITVPTPILADKTPDLSHLIAASTSVAKVLSRSAIVIYESTTYPGCTEEVCIPILTKYSGLIINKDYGVGYSPERISPGDSNFKLENIIKVTAGSDTATAAFVDQLYAKIIKAGTFLAPSIRVAEAAKLIENCQRDVNISFMNELVLIFDKLNLDFAEVINAAKTKPNFLSFRPGLVGGHCISVDPFYMIHKAQEAGYSPAVIGAGRRVNDGMSTFVAHKCMKSLSSMGIALLGAEALILGLAYKPNTDDTRNSKTLEIYKELTEFGMKVKVYDPLVNKDWAENTLGINFMTELGQNKYDLIITATHHAVFAKLDLNQFSKDPSFHYSLPGN